MRSLVVFLYLTISWVEAQNGRGPQHQDHTGHGWDIRLAVPGEPGNDYPTLGAIPRTTFSCAGREPGYYADLETNCQVFRVCTVGSTYGFQSFLCPNGTLFNQAVFVCDWWMNVDCQNSQQFFTNNDQKFENLRLGPELMKDIKKMLTHPMRNPLDKNAMKSNLIVMQDYKPPSGQLFPNGALLAGPERPPNNVYVPSKLINQFGQNNLNDITFSASTPEPRYLSGQLNTNQLLSQSNADTFQRQRQDGQYNIGRTQSTQTLQSGNLISNGHAGRYVQNTGLNNNGYSQLPRPTQNTFSQTQPSITNTALSRNTQRGGSNRPRAQYTEPRKLSQPNDKQNNFGASLKSQNQNFNNQDKQTTSVFPQFSNVVDTAPGRELKQNLALVYSFLADSINVAREYNNIATQEVLSSTPATSQFQNMNTEDLSQITNKVSQLTSSQFSSNNFNNLGNQANIVSTQTTSTNPATQFRSNARYTEEQNQPRQVQSSQYNRIPSQQTQQLYSSQLQATGNTQTNLNNQVYSGQLYQWPVPDVTDQIYNRPISAELLSSHQQNTQMNQQSGNLINAPNFQQNPNFEVVKAKTIPFNPTKLHLEPPSAPTPFTSQETLNLLNGDNGISAHLQDKIVGTIAHPSDANKRVTYKKDQSYYLYTKLEDNTLEQNNPRSVQSNNDQQNAKLTQGNAQNHLAFELVPSVSYELEDEKEQEKILNAFRIDEFGAPREITREITTNNAGENINERKDVSADPELFVENQASNKQTGQYRINALYDGPSSYSAPQSSVGSLEGLEARQVVQNKFSSRLEDLDNNSDGYPKERPARKFTF